MSLVAAKKQKYLQAKYDARKAAAETMSELLGVAIQLSEWSNRCFEAIEAQWPGGMRRAPSFDWREIHRRYREPNQFDFAIWVGDRLCAMGLALVRAEYVHFAFLEADPRSDCPLSTKRILVALETVGNYVQACGRDEIRVEPATPKLVDIYQNVYEFELVTPRKGPAYCRKRV